MIMLSHGEKKHKRENMAPLMKTSETVTNKTVQCTEVTNFYKLAFKKTLKSTMATVIGLTSAGKMMNDQQSI